jgi:hypothetical protein
MLFYVIHVFIQACAFVFLCLWTHTQEILNYSKNGVNHKNCFVLNFNGFQRNSFAYGKVKWIDLSITVSDSNELYKAFAKMTDPWQNKKK